MAALRQATAGMAGDRHDGDFEFPERRQQTDDFFRFAAVGKDECTVATLDAPQVAVQRLAGMDEVAGRAGGSQSGRQLLPDQARFSHSRYDGAATACQQNAHDPAEIRVQPLHQPFEGSGLGEDDLAPISSCPAAPREAS